MEHAGETPGCDEGQRRCLRDVRKPAGSLPDQSAGLRNPSVLQRCFRDMSVGAQHIYVDPRCQDEMGKGLLEVAP